MHTADASAVLPHEKPQVLDGLVLKDAALLRFRQLSDLTTARAKVEPKGDRMKIAAGD